jgi:NAD(P)-dependent dehydrogenase (short-subunit alcohol dehydrogenase family)
VKPGRYTSLFDLSGRVAVVTGGGGLLGRHFAAGLADAGAAVALADIDLAAAAEAAADIEQSLRRPALAIECDVASEGSVAAMVASVEAELGPIRILHNNAATKGSSPEQFFSPVHEFDAAVWREIMGVNLDGMFIVAKAVGSRMAERGAGSIIQTSSIYGVLGPDQRIYEGSEYLGSAINTPPVYAASKAAVIGLTRYLATYWAPHGVRVNCLSPGGVSSGQNETFRRNYSARVPMQRMAEAEELVGALLFLASDAAGYVTGQNILVDGGLSAW